MTSSDRRSRHHLPEGTVTFMFTDIEGSTEIVRALGDQRVTSVLERHNELIRAILDDQGGVEVATEGDAFFAVFQDPLSSIRAAIEIQKAIIAERWTDDTVVRVRIGVHTGNGVLGADNYVGVDVHRAQRVASAAHGGQVLVSQATADLVAAALPGGTEIEDLGRFRMAGFPQPERLFMLVSPGLPGKFPPPRGALSASRLPTPMSAFVGREIELGRGIGLISDHRLLTLTGPGGTGKTRLAIEIARRVEDRFEDGAFFVPLASIRDPDLIPVSILDVVGLSTAGAVAPIEHLESYLSDRSVMLILDNLEQLIAGAATVSRLLASAPGLKVLATSRTPLRIGGERELQVPPLAIPAGEAGDMEQAGVPGVSLFAIRAAAVRPGFELDESNIGVIATITRALDGLPLAIELAASRMRSLTPELILDRLDNRLLSSSSADLPERQRTILGAVGWSYDLLDEPTRKLFELASVFVGGFGLEQAERVCLMGDTADVLEGLIDLVESSLILQTESSGQPRFRMLTVIREYGYAALVARGAEAEAQDRHASAFLDLAEAADREILTSRQGYWLERLAMDHDNLRAASDYVIARKDADTAMRLAACLWRFWQIRGHLEEGARRTEEALALDGGDPRSRGKALTALAGIRYWQGDWQATLHPYRKALELFREAGDEMDVAEALYNLSFATTYDGNPDRSEELLDESLRIAERLNWRIGIGRAHWGKGNVAASRGDWDTVVTTSLRAAEEFSDLDAPFDLGWSWFMVAHANLRAGRSAEARPYLIDALEVFGSVLDLSGLSLVLETFSVLAHREDDIATAARLLGAANRIKASTGVAIGEVDVNQYPEMADFLEQADETTRAAYHEGLALSAEEAVSIAKGNWLI